MRGYRLLLRLYPAAFRHDYERELIIAFSDQLAVETTLAGRCICLAAASAGVLRNAPKEHLFMSTADLRYTFRTFLRSPGFTLVALATLSLGIGVNSALFSVVKSVLLEALPYGRPEQLVRVWVTNPTQGYDHDVTSFPRLEDWRARSKSIGGFSAFRIGRQILTGLAEPRQLTGALVSPNFLRVMQVRPLLGRDFEEGEDRPESPGVIILSHGLWRREFGADPGILGRQLRLSGLSYTVVGVLPPAFVFPDRNMDFWMPLSASAQARQARGNFSLNVVARLRDGVNIRQAQAEMDNIGKALAREYVDDRNLGVALVGLRDDLTGPIRPALLVLTGAVLCVLLICCANIAGMLTARAASRERELSIRAALGAGRSRVVRQLLTEAIALFLWGGVFGVGVAIVGLRLLLRLAPPELPQLQDTHVDYVMVGLTLVVSALCGLIFGLRPALRASRMDVMDSLKQGGRSLIGRVDSQRFRRTLTVGEMALAMMLLAAAGLLVRSFQSVERVELGFDPQDVSLAQLQLPRTKYSQGATAVDLYDRLLDRLQKSPGVQSAAAVSTLLLRRLPNSTSFAIEGRSETIQVPITTDSVTPGFFSTMKIPLLKGRFFNAQDHAKSPPVAIVNATTAHRYWPGEDPVGKRFTYGDSGPRAQWLTIVGVVADTRRAGVDQPVFTESYTPLAQSPSLGMQILVRASPGAARTAIAGALHELDREQPLGSVISLQTALGDRVASRRFTTLLMMLFAATALTIAGVGIYGLISYLVTQRRQEFGVRVALGAQAADVMRLVVGGVMAMAGVGLALGLAGALLLSRGLEGLLFGIGRFDPRSYAVAAAGLLLVCLAAAVSPVVRALRVDPLTALREE